MPIYEYKCTRCSAARDVRHGFKEANTEICAACGGELKRVFNPAGIVFKGSGFYINDSRKPATEAKPESKSDGKSDGKPDGKPEAAPKTEVKGESKPEPKGKGDAAA